MSTMQAIRCPRCTKKLAEHLEGGLLLVYCRACREIVKFDKRIRATVK